MNAPTTPLLVVGLGDPGLEYEPTRHNAGRLMPGELVSRTSSIPSSFNVHKKSSTEIAQTRFRTSNNGERQVTLAKPRTYMNLSGGPIVALTKFFDVAPIDVVVAHDELDLDPSVVRLGRGGGENGHNGLRSTSKSLGIEDYMRVRIDVDHPPGRQDPADYVLRGFNTKEREELALTLPIIAEIVELIVGHGLGIAQNQIHGR